MNISNITSKVDRYLENGSGYASAIMLQMWLYKYGLDITPVMQENAFALASDNIRHLCIQPATHSNYYAQEIISELY